MSLYINYKYTLEIDGNYSNVYVVKKSHENSVGEPRECPCIWYLGTTVNPNRINSPVGSHFGDV